MKKAFPLFYLLLIAFVFWQLGFKGAIKLRPQSIHQWAQVNRASVARNYYEENMNFFQPRVHETKNTTGITGMEFPIMNYLAAISYKILGFNETYYRLLNMLAVAILMLLVLFLLKELLGNYFDATLLSLVFLLSPVMNYYIPNFLPDVISLLVTIAGWYWFFRFRRSGKKWYLVWMCIFLASGGLLKITSLISSVVIMLVVLLDYARKFIRPRSSPWLISRWKIFMMVSLAIFITACWYAYAYWLSEHHRATYFLLGLRPAESKSQFLSIFSQVYELWVPYYYPKVIYVLLAAGTLFIAFKHKYIKRLYLFITLGLYAGAAIFLFLMWTHINDHDYYVIPLFIAVFFHFILIADTIHKQNNLLPAVIYYIVLLALPYYMLSYSKLHQFERYNTLWMNNPEITFLPRYEGMEEYLRSIGVQRHQTTVSIHDYSSNISLYFMDQKGWAIAEWHDESRIHEAFQHSEWAVINDSTVMNKAVFKQYLTREAGEYNGLKVFRLKE